MHQRQALARSDGNCRLAAQLVELTTSRVSVRVKLATRGDLLWPFREASLRRRGLWADASDGPAGGRV